MAPRGDGLSLSLEAGFRSDGVRAPGLGDCLQELPTGVEGREEEPLVVTGRGSWVGFLGDEGVILGAAAAPFLGSVGVQAGETGQD